MRNCDRSSLFEADESQKTESRTPLSRTCGSYLDRTWNLLPAERGPEINFPAVGVRRASLSGISLFSFEGAQPLCLIISHPQKAAADSEGLCNTDRAACGFSSTCSPCAAEMRGIFAEHVSVFISVSLDEGSHSRDPQWHQPRAEAIGGSVQIGAAKRRTP
jgi:hypothetical protein